MHVIGTRPIFLLGYTFSYMTAAFERRDVPFCLAVHLEHDSDTRKILPLPVDPPFTGYTRQAIIKSFLHQKSCVDRHCGFGAECRPTFWQKKKKQCLLCSAACSPVPSRMVMTRASLDRNKLGCGMRGELQNHSGVILERQPPHGNRIRDAYISSSCHLNSLRL